MDYGVQLIGVKSAAGTDIQRKWHFPGKTVKLQAVKLDPNATSAIHASNYVDVKVYVGSTQIGSTRSTNSSTGSAFTANTLESLDISPVAPSNLEVSSTNRLKITVTNAASGVAIDVDYVLTYMELQ